MWCESLGMDVPAADLFDTAVFGRSGPGPEAFGLEVIAGPGQALPNEIEPGWVVVGRALGEGRLAWIETIESTHDDGFAEVAPSGQARRLSDGHGRCLPNMLILRAHHGTGMESAFQPEFAAEVATDPMTPVRPRITLRASVGTRGGNRPAEVASIQQRLRDLRFLSAADFTAESVAGSTATTAVADASIPRTIAAIEEFQREVVAITPDGNVGRTGQTLRKLNATIPRPDAAQYAAVATARATITETVHRGVTLTGSVGDTSSGNAAADVTAVQTRLVQLGTLRAAHGEAPTGTGAVPKASLSRTIAAIVRFQRRADFWKKRRTVTGSITRGVITPGDASAAFLSLVSTYVEAFPGTAGTVTLSDHVRSGHTRSAAGVALSGSARPSALALTDFTTLGLSALDANALRYVSRHEGNFDAINTYDRARVSVGFIQFAGGRGLPPYLALLKSRQPATFETRLGQYGIDIEFSVSSSDEAIDDQVVVLDPAGSTVLRGDAAEEAIRANKKLSAAFVMSGRDRVVQLVQIEAAIRNYVIPAKAFGASWGAVRTNLGTVIRSQRGRAMLFDRAIQQGTSGGPAQFRDALRFVHAATPMATVAAAQGREADVLTQVEANLRVGATINTAMREAADALVNLRRRASSMTVTAALAHADLTTARARVDAAVAALPGLSPGRKATRLGARLPAARTRLNFSPAPATVAALRAELLAVSNELKEERKPIAASEGFRRRIERIRTSTLTGP